MGANAAEATKLGPWIISGIALVQVWVIEAYRRYRPAKLDLYESGNIELGYSDFGPTVGLVGTLRTRHRDFFVRNLSVQIVRKRDNMTRRFDWRAFRSHKLSLSGAQVDPDLPASFLLTPEEPFNYNIFFADETFVAETKSKVESIFPAWLTFLASHTSEHHGTGNEALVAEFLQTPGPLDAFAALDRSFYWTAGEYSLQIDIGDERGKARTLRKFTFEITQVDETNLRSNVVAIERSLCGVGSKYAFAYPKYRPE